MTEQDNRQGPRQLGCREHSQGSALGAAGQDSHRHLPTGTATTDGCSMNTLWVDAPVGRGQVTAGEGVPGSLGFSL